MSDDERQIHMGLRFTPWGSRVNDAMDYASAWVEPAQELEKLSGGLFRLHSCNPGYVFQVMTAEGHSEGVIELSVQAVHQLIAVLRNEPAGTEKV